MLEKYKRLGEITFKRYVLNIYIYILAKQSERKMVLNIACA